MVRSRHDSSALIVSPSQVAAFRLSRHYLLRRGPRSALASVVRDVCGVQAQVMSAARIALWARIAGLADEDIDRALEADRSLVRTWAVRGTVHILASEDLPLYIAVIKETIHRTFEAWLVRQGLHVSQIRALNEAIVEALSRGPCTRDEIVRHAGKSFPVKIRKWLASGWGGLLRPVCFEGRVCFGPSRGREVTFVRREQWLPDWRDIPYGEAGADLLRRYLRAYGPARLSDFSAWSGVPVKAATTFHDRLSSEVASVSIDGPMGLLLREDLDALRRARLDTPGVRLLPNFDGYLLGHRSKEHLVDSAHYKHVYRKAGWISPVILVDGRVAGVWSHARKGRTLQVRIDPFRRMSADVRRLVTDEARDLGRFLETEDVRVTVT